MKPRSTEFISLASIGVSFLLVIVVFGLVKPGEDLAFSLILIHSVIMVLILGANLYPLGLILILGFLLRLLFLYLDLATEISVFSSGQDTENFYQVSALVYEQPSLFREEMYGGVFPKLVGALFWIVGPSRELVQYLNVLLSISSLILMSASAKKLGAKDRNIYVVLLVCAVMPISASISAIFLRESLITFFVAISVFFFCSWLKSGRVINAIGSLIALALGGVFHLGVFGIVLGYVFAFFLFDSSTGRFNFSFQRLVSMIPILGGFILLISSFSDLFLEKLETVSSTADVLSRASVSRGGSAYLPGIEINSGFDFLLFGGLKGLLLLVSPPPWVWRGGTDIVAFAFDGLCFFVAICVVVIGFRRSTQTLQKRILALLMIGVISVALVIGAGTGNSGTAMRHRQKIVPLIAVSVMFAMPATRSKWKLENKAFQHPERSFDIHGARK